MITKILKILLVVIVIFAVGLGVYWFFDRQQGGTGDPFSNYSLNVGNFFPFGEGGPNTTDTTNPGTNTPGDLVSTSTLSGTVPGNTQSTAAAPRLWQISAEPQSGAVSFAASGTTYVRFVDRSTGNIFESTLARLGLKRISNTTIPKVYEAHWQAKGDAAIFRYLSEDKEIIRSTFGKLVVNSAPSETEAPPKELQAIFLPEQISSLSVNQTTGAVVFVTKNLVGSTISVANTATATPKQIFSSPIKDFSVSWVNKNTIGLSSKASAAAAGQFYFLKSDTGVIERVLGGQIGLVALASPDAKKVVYSESKNGSLASSILDLKTGERTALPFTTLPEKCVWASKSAFLYCATPKSFPSGTYPDAWYQGLVSFDDMLWRVDTATGATEFIIDPFITAKTELDATSLSLDPTEEYLIFTNKKDAHLWGLRINPNEQS